jgi:DNA (cytosine-5)-methyltransferase 1
MDNKIIDLFSGAGGLTTGFHLAGFESLGAIDQNKKALQTYHHNYPNAKVICDDIRNVVPPLPEKTYLCSCPKRG